MVDTFFEVSQPLQVLFTIRIWSIWSINIWKYLWAACLNHCIQIHVSRGLNQELANMLNGTHNVEAMRKLWVISSYLSWSPLYFAQNMGPTSGASCHWTKTGFFNGNMLILFLTPDSTGPARVVELTEVRQQNCMVHLVSFWSATPGIKNINYKYTQNRQTTKQFNHVAYSTPTEAWKLRKMYKIYTISASQQHQEGRTLNFWSHEEDGTKQRRVTEMCPVESRCWRDWYSHSFNHSFMKI